MVPEGQQITKKKGDSTTTSVKEYVKNTRRRHFVNAALKVTAGIIGAGIIGVAAANSNSTSAATKNEVQKVSTIEKKMTNLGEMRAKLKADITKINETATWKVRGNAPVKEFSEKDPIRMEPMPGTNQIALANAKDLDMSGCLTKLDAQVFDGNEEQLVQMSKEDGCWAHFFFNEKWNGYLLVLEKYVNGGMLGYTITPSEGGKLIKPLTKIEDKFNNFVIVESKGIDYSIDGDARFISLVSKFGVEELQNPRFEESTVYGKKVVTLKVSNSTGRMEFYYDKNEKLEDGKSFPGVSISQR